MQIQTLPKALTDADTIKGWSPQCEEGEYLIIRSSNIRLSKFSSPTGELRPRRTMVINSLQNGQPDPQYTLKAGDLVVSRERLPKQLVGSMLQ